MNGQLQLRVTEVFTATGDRYQCIAIVATKVSRVNNLKKKAQSMGFALIPQEPVTEGVSRELVAEFS